MGRITDNPALFDLYYSGYCDMPVQNRVFTTEAPFDRLTALSKVEGLRTQRIFCLSGGPLANAWH
jgi:hypothetical protein